MQYHFQYRFAAILFLSCEFLYSRIWYQIKAKNHPFRSYNILLEIKNSLDKNEPFIEN